MRGATEQSGWAGTRSLAAYADMFADCRAVATPTADDRNPLLGHHADDEAFQSLRQSEYQRRSQGEYMRGQPIPNPRVFALSPAATPTRRSFVDFADFRTWVTMKYDGTPLDDSREGHRHILDHVRTPTERGRSMRSLSNRRVRVVRADE